MNKQASTKFFFAALTLLAFSSESFASPIPGLYNTGVNDAGTILTTDSQDLHYKFIIVTPGTAVTTDGIPFVSHGLPETYIANDSSSQWLSPTTDGYQSYDPVNTGWYAYDLIIDLTGFDKSQTSFTGQWALDQGGYAFLNGVQISEVGSVLNLSDYSPFDSWHAFGANSGFIDGLNTLRFLVGNPPQVFGNPIGLRVQFLEGSTAPIPEPETYALMLAGLAVVGAAAKRRRKST